MERKDEIQIVRDFVSLINNLDAHWDGICNDISKADQEISDLLHEIELEEFTESESYRLLMDLKTVRKVRRFSKDNQDIVRYLKDFVDRNSHLKISLQKTLNQMNKIKDSQPQRKYTPRVRTESKFIDDDTEATTIKKLNKKEASDLTIIQAN